MVLQFIGSMFGVPAWGPRLERLQDTFVSKSLVVQPLQDSFPISHLAAAASAISPCGFCGAAAGQPVLLHLLPCQVNELLMLGSVAMRSGAWFPTTALCPAIILLLHTCRGSASSKSRLSDQARLPAATA
jgi:hypothetical protein